MKDRNDFLKVKCWLSLHIQWLHASGLLNIFTRNRRDGILKKERKGGKKTLLPHANIKKKATSTNCTTTGWRSPADIQRQVSVFREAWGSAPSTAREPDLWVLLDFNSINDPLFQLKFDCLNTKSETCFLVTSSALLKETWELLEWDLSALIWLKMRLFS